PTRRSSDLCIVVASTTDTVSTKVGSVRERRIALRRMIGLVVLSLTAASCGGGAPESGETSVTVDSTTAATVSEETETDVQPDEELIELQVGYIAVSSAAPLFVAEQSGIFESHGLAVTLVPLEPPSMIPSAVAGDIHFGFLNAPAVLIARQNNLPVKAVASISAIGDDPA